VARPVQLASGAVKSAQRVRRPPLSHGVLRRQARFGLDIALNWTILQRPASPPIRPRHFRRNGRMATLPSKIASLPARCRCGLTKTDP